MCVVPDQPPVDGGDIKGWFGPGMWKSLLGLSIAWTRGDDLVLPMGGLDDMALEAVAMPDPWFAEEGRELGLISSSLWNPAEAFGTCSSLNETEGIRA